MVNGERFKDFFSLLVTCLLPWHLYVQGLSPISSSSYFTFCSSHRAMNILHEDFKQFSGNTANNHILFFHCNNKYTGHASSHFLESGSVLRLQNESRVPYKHDGHVQGEIIKGLGLRNEPSVPTVNQGSDVIIKNQSKSRGGSNKKHQNKCGSDGKLILGDIQCYTSLFKSSLLDFINHDVGMFSQPG